MKKIILLLAVLPIVLGSCGLSYCNEKILNIRQGMTIDDVDDEIDTFTSEYYDIHIIDGFNSDLHDISDRIKSNNTVQILITQKNFPRIKNVVKKTYYIFAFENNKLIYWGMPLEFNRHPDKKLNLIGKVAAEIIVSDYDFVPGNELEPIKQKYHSILGNSKTYQGDFGDSFNSGYGAGYSYEKMGSKSSSDIYFIDASYCLGSNTDKFGIKQELFVADITFGMKVRRYFLHEDIKKNFSAYYESGLAMSVTGGNNMGELISPGIALGMGANLPLNDNIALSAHLGYRIDLLSVGQSSFYGPMEFSSVNFNLGFRFGF